MEIPKYPRSSQKHRKVVYLNPKYSRLYDAFAYYSNEESNRRGSPAGFKMIKAFLDKIPEGEQKRLLENYDKHVADKFRDGDDGN